MHTWPNFGFTVAYVGSGGSLSLTPLAGAIAFTGYAPTVASSGGGGTLTLSVTESVSSGVAPFAVFFDATASTSTQTTRPIHDVFYAWDFGDTTAGTWANGTGANTSKNAAYGPVSSHVFETAGTYTVTLTAFDGVSISSTTKTITVTAADAEWTGLKTVYYSTGAAPVAGVNGVLSGAVYVGGVTDLSASFAANKGTGNKRHLLQAGQTFNTSGQIIIDVGGPSMFGKFGTGTTPVVNATSVQGVFRMSSASTPTTVSDWRIQDIKVFGNNTTTYAVASAHHFHDLLMLRMEAEQVSNLVWFPGSQIDASNAAVPGTHALWDKWFVVDCTVYNLQTSASGPNAIFGNGRRIAVMGCNIDNNANGEHGFRFQQLDRGVISCNTIQGIAVGKVNITVRGPNFAGTSTIPAGEYSEKIVISDNYLVAGDSPGVVGFGPENGTIVEVGRNIIFERNFILGSVSSTNMITISSIDTTLRNNMINMPSVGNHAFGFLPGGIVPSPTRGAVYNNTVYKGNATDGGWGFVSLYFTTDSGNPNPTMAGCTFDVKNNIIYVPNHATGWHSLVQKAAELDATCVTTQSNNTLGSNFNVNPLLATTPPTAIAHFTPAVGSYAQAGGVNVKNWRDFYNTATQATPDMGAVVI